MEEIKFYTRLEEFRQQRIVGKRLNIGVVFEKNLLPFLTILELQNYNYTGNPKDWVPDNPPHWLDLCERQTLFFSIAKHAPSCTISNLREKSVTVFLKKLKILSRILSGSFSILRELVKLKKHCFLYSDLDDPRFCSKMMTTWKQE